MENRSNDRWHAHTDGASDAETASSQPDPWMDGLAFAHPMNPQRLRWELVERLQLDENAPLEAAEA
jgi:hypothetical protein